MKCKQIVLALIALALPIPGRSQSIAADPLVDGNASNTDNAPFQGSDSASTASKRQSQTNPSSTLQSQAKAQQSQANAATVGGYAPGDPAKPFAPYNLASKNAQGQTYCDVFFPDVFDAIINGVSDAATTNPPTTSPVPISNGTIPIQSNPQVSVAGTGLAPTHMCDMPSYVPIVPANIVSSSSSISISHIVSSPTPSAHPEKCSSSSSAYISPSPTHPLSSSSSKCTSKTKWHPTTSCSSKSKSKTSKSTSKSKSKTKSKTTSKHNISHRSTPVVAEAAIVVAQTSVFLPNATPGLSNSEQISAKSFGEGSFIEDLFNSFE